MRRGSHGAFKETAIVTPYSWPVLLLASAAALFLLNLAVHLIYAVLALGKFEVRPAFKVAPPPQDAPLPEDVRFRAMDGLELAGGVYYPPDGQPRGVVVYCPETDGGYLTAMNYTAALLDAGFAVFSFSFRNHEPSQSLPGYHATHWLTNHEISDVHAALDFIAAQPQFAGLPVGLVGVSRGAGVALAGGADRPDVSAVWAQGAFSTQRLTLHYSVKFVQTVVGAWGKFIPEWHVAVTVWFMLRMAQWRNGCTFVRLEDYLARWKSREVMFLSGARDTYVPCHMSQLLCQMTGHAPDTAHWNVPGAKHNQERMAAPREFDERIVQFFDRMTVPAEQPARRAALLA